MPMTQSRAPLKPNSYLPSVGDAAKPSERDGCRHGAQVFRPEVGEPLGDDVARHDRVDGNACPGQLERSRANEAELAGLAGTVV